MKHCVEGRMRSWTAAACTAIALLGALGRAAPADPAGSGGGGWSPAADDLAPARRAEIEAQLAAARAARPPAYATLASEPVPVAFAWPLRARDGFPHPGHHGVSYFVDLDPAFPDRLLDWGCGARTYDRASGYNHSGVDIFLWPFPWTRMLDEDVEVVAAAPGVLLFKDDGHFDGSCDAGDAPWNAVYLEHADGSVTWYGHMKNGSVTDKGVGEPVAAGERLGLVGSSGSSSAPHLHFEVHDAAGAVIEPFAGDCRPGASSWAEQRPYWDSALNQASTHDGVPEIDACNRREEARRRDRFLPGEEVFFATFYRDQLAGQVAVHAVRRPDGSVFETWESSSPEPHYASSWWYRSFVLPPGAPAGAWSFEVDFAGQHVVHAFSVPEPRAAAPAALAALAALSARRRGSRGQRAR
jgi:murein DD-endopeptidase MepM/ murein hydrolase activator NlpD